MDILGYSFPKDDPQTYLLAWVILTLVLVAIASRWGVFALTTALAIFVAVALKLQPTLTKGS